MLVNGILVKLFAAAAAVIVILFVVLYIFGPYLIKDRFNNGEVAPNPQRYIGLDALPKNGTILFVTAHPDDLEFMAGGTVPKLIERGNRIFMVILTDGGKQRYAPRFYSKRIVATRHREQLAISEEMGLEKVFFENYKDGYLTFSEGAVEKVERVVNEIQAGYIFTFESGKRDGYYDSDHDAAGQVGSAAAENNLAIAAVYYFRAEDPDIVIDISDTFEEKMKALFEFTEFRYKKRFLRAMHESWAASDGKRIGVTYAEAFRKIDLTTGRVKDAEPTLTGERTN
jgi:LmbE family N-acetylglucosaminyl deacetylase